MNLCLPVYTGSGIKQKTLTSVMSVVIIGATIKTVGEIEGHLKSVR